MAAEQAQVVAMEAQAAAAVLKLRQRAVAIPRLRLRRRAIMVVLGWPPLRLMAVVAVAQVLLARLHLRLQMSEVMAGMVRHLAFLARR